jgi:hypothetical protein
MGPLQYPEFPFNCLACPCPLVSFLQFPLSTDLPNCLQRSIKTQSRWRCDKRELSIPLASII